MTRDEFMNIVYSELHSDGDNYRANRIIDAADEYAEEEVTTVDDVLDKIKSEMLDEAEYAYADFDRYKEDILHAEPDELPDDDFRYGLERAVEIINKYKAENEVQE